MQINQNNDEKEKWPNPLKFLHFEKINELSNPPEIPPNYEIFGISFQKQKNHVKLINEEYEDLNINEIRRMVKKSYSLFRNILKDPNNKELIVELRDLHILMNIKINNAKKWEIKNKL